MSRRAVLSNGLRRRARWVIFGGGVVLILAVGLWALGGEDASGRWAAQTQGTAVALAGWFLVVLARWHPAVFEMRSAGVPAAWSGGASACLVTTGLLDPHWTQAFFLAGFVVCTLGLAFVSTRRPAPEAVGAQIAATLVSLAFGAAAISLVRSSLQDETVGPLWHTWLLPIQLALATFLAAVQLAARAAFLARRRTSSTHRLLAR